jgi:pyruvate kinase
VEEPTVSDDRTKIIATLGPASDDPAVLERMVVAGVDVFRLNFSHGTRAEHLARLDTIRKVCDPHGGHVAILVDLQGPKIRVGELPGGSAELAAGSTVELVSGVERAEPPVIPVVYDRLAADVGPGDRILLDDGALELRVAAVDGDTVRAEVKRGGELRSRKGVNLPGVQVSAPSMTAKDLADLQLAVEGEVDYVALSFVRRAGDVEHARDEIRRLGGDIPIVAKLERPEAIERLDDILAVSDAVMVARGDLGVEVAVEKVPAIQKHVIARSNACGVPVITATQMLESMIANPTPTRAEASDVANAVFDGTDAAMLSGETAIGRWPVESVEAMMRIVHEAEATPHLSHPPAPPTGGLDVTATVCRAAVAAAADLDARAIVAFSSSGATARFVSRFRPRTPVIGLTPFESTRRRMALYWGVEAPRRVDRSERMDEMLRQADQRLLEGGWAGRGDVAVVVSGGATKAGATNRMIVHRVGDLGGDIHW